MTRYQPHIIGEVYLFLRHEGRVLLSRRFQTGYEDGKYSVPAGHMEGNEEVRAALIREAREEIGIELALDDLAVVGVMHSRSDSERVSFFVLAERVVACCSSTGRRRERVQPGMSDRVAAAFLPW